MTIRYYCLKKANQANAIAAAPINTSTTKSGSYLLGSSAISQSVGGRYDVDFVAHGSGDISFHSNASAAVVRSSRKDLRSEFESLVKQWKEETFPISSLTKKYGHPAYIRIMAMGGEGIGLVLQELRQSGGRWFYALKFMAGTDISAGMDNFEDARAAWLTWGYKNNYI